MAKKKRKKVKEDKKMGILDDLKKKKEIAPEDVPEPKMIENKEPAKKEIPLFTCYDEAQHIEIELLGQILEKVGENTDELKKLREFMEKHV